MAGRVGTRRMERSEPAAWWTVAALGLAALLVVGLLGVVVYRHVANARAVRVRLVAHDGIPLLTEAPVTETGLSGSFTGSRDVRSEIEQQIVNAMVLEQRMGISPTPATTNAAQANVVAIFPLVFTPAQAARERAQLAQSNRRGDGIHLVATPTDSGSTVTTAATNSTSATNSVVDGGIDWARFRSLTSHGTTAVANAQVRSWLRTGRRDAGGRVTRPTNTLTIQVTLRAVSGRWLVDTIDWHFAPGSEP